VGRKNVLPLILCSEKKNSYVIVGISPLGTTRGVGDLSEEDQVSRGSWSVQGGRGGPLVVGRRNTA
jgi:hypothetical protein